MTAQPQTNSATVQQAPAMQPATVQPAAGETPAPAKELSIGISQAAVDAIAVQVAKRNKQRTALRVGVKGGGCSGFSYVIEFHDGEPRARDRVYDLQATSGAAVRVLVDPKSLIYLNGAELTWEKTLMRQGFKWQNPQEESNCGCGHSFTV
jgi:iron-sulfur cluster assembly protein